MGQDCGTGWRTSRVTLKGCFTPSCDFQSVIIVRPRLMVVRLQKVITLSHKTDFQSEYIYPIQSQSNLGFQGVRFSSTFIR